MTVGGGVLAAVGLAGLGPVGADASSHREAPLIAGQPRYDNTDLYAFRSPERPNTVTLVANWIPFEEPGGGPNFYAFATDARYDINVDNNGDAKADVVYRWRFKDHYRSRETFLYNTGPVTSLGDADLNFWQTYTLYRIDKGKVTTLVKNRRVAPSDVGKGSMPNYARLRDQAVRDSGTGPLRTRSFAGQAEDPFFVDLRVFDLLYGGDLSETGDDTLAGFNVNTVAVQVPRRDLAFRNNATANPVVGVWSTTSKRTASGRYQQVSRLGLPLVNEAVLPIRLKNAYNASKPVDDLANAGKYILNPLLPATVEAVYPGQPAPPTPRNDLLPLVTGFEGLNQTRPANKIVPSDQLRINMTTPLAAEPDRLGVIGGDVQGFPNGRRLADDVTDISVRVLEGALTDRDDNDLEDGFSDGVDENDAAFGNTFPYVALPVRGNGKGAILEQRACRETHVLRETLQRAAAAHIAPRVLDQEDVPELALRFTRRFRGRHAARHVVASPHREVEAQFLIDLPREFLLMEKSCETGAREAEEVHEFPWRACQSFRFHVKTPDDQNGRLVTAPGASPVA